MPKPRVKSLIIGTTSHYSGRTLVCLGLGRRFINDGLNIGYLKPLGTTPAEVNGVATDEDAALVSQALGIKEAPELFCPVPLTKALVAEEFEKHVEGLEKKILDAHEKLSKDKELMLVGGMGSLIEGRFLHLSGMELVKLLDAKVVIVDHHETDTYCLDHILYMKDRLGERLAGVILNKVAPEKMEFFKGSVVPFLERHKINVLGVIPHDDILNALTVGELKDILGGVIICCEHKKDALIEKMNIGAMNVEGAMKVFQKTKNKAVITGADRLDIQLAALETSTRCMVLTGDLYPSDVIINRATDLEIPIIIVNTDTLSTIERFENMAGKFRIRSAKKIDRAAQLINETVDFKTLYEEIGISVG